MIKFYLLVFWVLFPITVMAQDRLAVDQNLIKTQDGDTITLRGVSLCSLDWHDPLSLINKVVRDKWNANVLRLPVQPQEWQKHTPEQYIQERIDPAVELCYKHNLYCIIDWHDIRPWTDKNRNNDLKYFWSKVAPRYAQYKNILYEIFNEPTYPNDKTIENWKIWRETAQIWINDIRKTAPDTILLIGSPHWSQMANFAEILPFEGNNLVYTAHIYPNYSPSEWNFLFGKAAEKVPVFISEWGWSEDMNASNEIKGTLENYALPLKKYLDGRPFIHWTAWSYDPKCAPSMLGYDTEMGEFVKNWLSGLRAN